MHELTARHERAILVSLRTPQLFTELDVADYSLAELKKLAETAGVECVAALTQNRPKIDTKWFVGKGKVDEIRQLIEAYEASTVIFDSELSGGQVRNLEHALDAKIIDRTQLILDIFAQRAHTREGFLQVELAQLNYLLPRLSGHGKNLSRLGGGIGTRGPGETKLETDRRHIRDRISDLKQQLVEVSKHRTLYRERRKKSGVIQVALVGYTNAGKSTLLNRMTAAGVLEEDLLFATLDPTSRTLALPNGRELVLTDTVGFIQNLPHELVAAFRATLEEVCEADLILHVVDASSSMREMQMSVVNEVLGQLGAHQNPQVVVFNKIDRLDEQERLMLFAEEPFLRISAYDEHDLIELKKKIEQLLSGDAIRYKIPHTRGDLMAHIYRLGQVIEQIVEEEAMCFTIIVEAREFERSGHLLAAYRVKETSDGDI
jgi:GTP-binding protein HflX